MKINAAVCLVFLFVPLAVLSAQSVESTFDGPLFRPLERLWGQGPEGLAWKGDATDLYEVIVNGGLDNSGALRVNHRNREFSGALWDIPPTALKLSPETLAQSKIAYRFSIRMQENQGDTVVSRIFLAGGAVRFEIYSQGSGFTFDGTKDPQSRHVTLRGPDNDRRAFPAAQWITVTGVIDYAAKTFTARINDVEQNGGQPIGMILDDDRQPDAGKVVNFSINTMRQTHSDWGPYLIDHVAFEVVP